MEGQAVCARPDSRVVRVCRNRQKDAGREGGKGKGQESSKVPRSEIGFCWLETILANEVSEVDGKQRFLAKWKDFDADESTWEPRENFDAETIQTYFAEKVELERLSDDDEMSDSDEVMHTSDEHEAHEAIDNHSPPARLFYEFKSHAKPPDQYLWHSVMIPPRPYDQQDFGAPMPEAVNDVQVSHDGRNFTRSREAQRVELLIDINKDLLQEANRLSLVGQRKEAAQIGRRLHANLQYLSLLALRRSGHGSVIPKIMSAPPEMPQLQGKYEELRQLFA